MAREERQIREEQAKRRPQKKKTTSENQSAGISGSDRLGTDRAGGRFYDGEIFI